MLSKFFYALGTNVQDHEREIKKKINISMKTLIFKNVQNQTPTFLLLIQTVQVDIIGDNGWIMKQLLIVYGTFTRNHGKPDFIDLTGAIEGAYFIGLAYS